MNTTMTPKVLLVDDDDLVRDMYRRLLGRQFDITVANGAEAAIEILVKDGPFAVVMSDFRMPRASGIDLLRHVRFAWPDTSRVLITGLLDLPELHDDSDLATIIEKPCAYADIAEVLRKEIAAYQLLKQGELQHDI